MVGWHHRLSGHEFEQTPGFVVRWGGKTRVLTRRTFVGKVMSLLFNMLSRLVITFLPRSKHLLISWLQSPSAVILENLSPTPRVHSDSRPSSR